LFVPFNGALDHIGRPDQQPLARILIRHAPSLVSRSNRPNLSFGQNRLAWAHVLANRVSAPNRRPARYSVPERHEIERPTAQYPKGAMHGELGK